MTDSLRDFYVRGITNNSTEKHRSALYEFTLFTIGRVFIQYFLFIHEGTREVTIPGVRLKQNTVTRPIGPRGGKVYVVYITMIMEI